MIAAAIFFLAFIVLIEADDIADAIRQSKSNENNEEDEES